MSIVKTFFIFLVAGIKQWQGQSLFVCILPFFFLALCMLLCVFFFGFFLFFSLVYWVGSSSLLFSLCIISFSRFLLCFCSGFASVFFALWFFVLPCLSRFAPFFSGFFLWFFSLLRPLLCSTFYKVQRACP